MNGQREDGREAAKAFDELADRYDAWFDSADGRPLFEHEVACLKDLVPADAGRWLEVGVGTGRFAEALGVKEGVDPSEPMLAFARARGVQVRAGSGEALPYPDGSFEGVLLVVTLCFLVEPAKALHECRRVLTQGGCLVVGLVPAGSAWARLYQRKGREGHPFYSVATFYGCDEVVRVAAEAGFRLDTSASCLFSAPGEPPEAGWQPGIVAGAGFVAMRFAASSKGMPRSTEEGG